jgi:Ca2+-binding RTX toxin-like protein
VGEHGEDQAFGGAGADTLNGGNDDDRLYGEAGDDYLVGGAGDDTLDGGDGFDFISYLNDGLTTGAQVSLAIQRQNTITDRGHDVLFSIEGVDGSAYDDFIDGSFVANVLRGNAGNDWIWGHGGADTLDGGDGGDYLGAYVLDDPTTSANGAVLLGGAGNDMFELGSGDMRAEGGTGSDTFAVGNLGGQKIIDGGAGVDTIQFEYRLGVGLEFEDGLTVDLSVTTAQSITANVTLVLSSIEKAWGSRGNDRITGNADDNYLDGLNGDDVVIGGGGNDVVSGRDGADTLSGGLGADSLYGGKDIDLFIFTPEEASRDIKAGDVIEDWQSYDRIKFTDGPVATSANFAKIEGNDWASALAVVDQLFLTTATRYVAVRLGVETYLFADTGAEGVTYDTIITLRGGTISIDSDAIIGV